MFGVFNDLLTPTWRPEQRRDAAASSQLSSRGHRPPSVRAAAKMADGRLCPERGDRRSEYTVIQFEGVPARVQNDTARETLLHRLAEP